MGFLSRVLLGAAVVAAGLFLGGTTEDGYRHQPPPRPEGRPGSRYTRHSTQRAEGSSHSAPEHKRRADDQIPPTQPIGRTHTTEKHDHHQSRLPFQKCSCSLCVRHSTQRAQGSSHAVPVYKRRTDDQIPTTQPTRPTHTTEKGDYHQQPPCSDEWPCPHCARNSTQRAEQSFTSAPEHKRRADDPPSTADVIPRVEVSYLTSDEDSGDEPESGDALRHRARLEGDRMSECFTQSQDAYKQGDHVDAKRLSEKANAHKREMERLNAMASARIFKENNMSLNPGRVDLHGLYVQEAISYAHEAIENARKQYYSDLRLIVGKGLHCVGDAKIKPAVTEAMTERGLDVEVDPNNAGVLIVRLESVWSLLE